VVGFTVAIVTPPFYLFAGDLAPPRSESPATSPVLRVPPVTIARVDAEGAQDLGVLDRAEAELEDVERALQRLDDGSYGTCEVCGEAIGDDRLAGSPVTRRCPAHGPGPAAPARAGT
jgi:hypothetical protein